MRVMTDLEAPSSPVRPAAAASSVGAVDRPADLRLGPPRLEYVLTGRDEH